MNVFRLKLLFLSGIFLLVEYELGCDAAIVEESTTIILKGKSTRIENGIKWFF